MNENDLNGIIYFSDGGNLIKYNFSENRQECLFKYKAENELGKLITHITYPCYLKTKNKILFIGSMLSEDRIFEADLDLKNWKEYSAIKNARVLSVSPDEGYVAYYQHPNKLIIKKLSELFNSNLEQGQIIADNILYGAKPLWVSNTEVVYDSIDNNVVRVRIDTLNQSVIANNIYCYSVSPDYKFILCASKTGIYLFDISTSELKLLKEVKKRVFSLDIWSPNGRFFLFSQTRELKKTINIFRFFNDLTTEYQDIYAYDIITGKEVKLFDNKHISGGFWLD